MNTAFWQIMHDGTIAAIRGEVPGDIELTVELECVCQHLPGADDTLHATLRGCRLFVYTPFGESIVTGLQRIAEQEPEVLSAVAQADRISVCCVNGTLDLAYAAIEVRSDQGQLISQPELEAAANQSVAQWREQNRGGRAAR